MTGTAAQLDRSADTEPHRGAPSAVTTAELCLSIDDTPILQGVSIEISAGASVALLGANGAGKSTLLRVLATLTPPSAGRLDLFGQAVGPQAAAVRSRIGVIAHQPMLYRDLTVRENLEFFARLYDVASPADRSMAVLDLVGLAHRADQAVKALSRGMTHRAAIARALIHGPDLLLADEPFDGLDVPSVRAMEALLRRLGDEGRTLIIANHDIAQSLSLADRVIVLRRGRVVIDAPAGGLGIADVLQEIAAA